MLYVYVYIMRHTKLIFFIISSESLNFKLNTKVSMYMYMCECVCMCVRADTRYNLVPYNRGNSLFYFISLMTYQSLRVI